jgi:hypothetical protein
MNIQEAIKSGKPFRRRGWLDEGVFVVYPAHDIVLTLESDTCISIELDVQDILADDWYTREEAPQAQEPRAPVYHQPPMTTRKEPAA